MSVLNRVSEYLNDSVRGWAGASLLALWVLAVTYIFINAPDSLNTEAGKTVFAASTWLQIASWVAAGAAYVSLVFNKEAWDTGAKKNSTHLLAIAPILFLTMAFYVETIADWFILDDILHLRFVRDAGLWSSFYDPGSQLSWSNFTPFLQLSFGLDYSAWGVNPVGFYAHHLLSFCAMLVAVYALATRVIPPVGAATILMAFVSTRAAMALATQLMTRHYIEGLAFAALSLLLFCSALHRKSIVLAIAGAVLYLFAALNKELYLPLVGLVPFLPVGTLHHRLKYGILYGFSALVYLIWRFSLQGNNLQLSAQAYDHQSLVGIGEYLSSLALSYPQFMQWTHLHLYLLMGLCFLCILSLSMKSSRQLLFLAVLGVCVLVPVFPVFSTLAGRFLLLLTLLVYGVAVYALYLRRSIWRIKPLVILVGSIVVLSGYYSARPAHQEAWAFKQKLEAEGRFMFENDEPDTALLTDDWLYLWEYKFLRENATTPYFATSQCLAPARIEKFYSYAGGAVSEVSADRTGCAQEASNIPLHVNLEVTRNLVKWDFGPWQSGSYAIVFEDLGALAAIPQGQVGRFPIDSSFRVWYQNDQGQFTVSESLEMNTASENKVSWSRE